MTGRHDGARRPVVDVVLLSGDAASAVAIDLAVGPYAPSAHPPRPYDLAACPWLAVASTRGVVVGVALARRRANADGAGCELLALEVYDQVNREYVRDRLFDVVGTLAPAPRWLAG